MRLPAGHFRHEDIEQGPRRVLLAAYAWIARRASHDPSLLPDPWLLQDRALPHHIRRPGRSRPGTAVRDRLTLPGPARSEVTRWRTELAVRDQTGPDYYWSALGPHAAGTHGFSAGTSGHPRSDEPGGRGTFTAVACATGGAERRVRIPPAPRAGVELAESPVGADDPGRRPHNVARQLADPWPGIASRHGRS